MHQLQRHTGRKMQLTCRVISPTKDLGYTTGRLSKYSAMDDERREGESLELHYHRP